MSPARGSPCLEQAPTPSPSYPAAGPGDGGQCHERAEHNDQKQYQQWVLLAQAVVSLVEEIFAGRRPGTEEAGHGLPRPSPEPLPWGSQGTDFNNPARPGPLPFPTPPEATLAQATKLSAAIGFLARRSLTRLPAVTGLLHPSHKPYRASVLAGAEKKVPQTLPLPSTHCFGSSS